MKKTLSSQKGQAVTAAAATTLAPYSGTFSHAEAAHLLRRTLFGPTLSQINKAVADGLQTTVDNLLTSYPVSPPLVEFDQDSVNIGQTWVDKPLPTNNTSEVNQRRRRSLRSWLIERVTENEELSVVEKLSFFWQNHFSCDYTSSDGQGGYEYLMLLRDNCLGDFKQLVKDLTVHPLMLRFLNGNTNTGSKPNENFARELFELYTIGKGPQLGNGDYTHYTEKDILEAAKILSGWRYRYRNATELPLIESYFTENRHDNSDKTLSSKFNNAVIVGNNEQEYADLIDVIFQQDQVAKFICGKLYRYFVNIGMESELDQNVINGMAQTMIANNYEVLPVLRELFLSEHFFDMANRGTIIKNPLELTASMLKSTNSKLGNLNLPVHDHYRILLRIHYELANTGLDYFQPPSVAGFTAYYLEPSFSHLWINSALIGLRFSMANMLTIWNGYRFNGHAYKIDSLGFLAVLEAESDPKIAENLIDQLVILFCCKPLQDTQRDALKKTLTDGLPDFEWEIEYTNYLNNPADTMAAELVEKRIQLVLSQLFKMPEFQIQ